MARLSSTDQARRDAVEAAQAQAWLVAAQARQQRPATAAGRAGVAAVAAVAPRWIAALRALRAGEVEERRWQACLAEARTRRAA